ncbi:hypothetical protein Tco_1262316 [Tanacetum coccineum]
MYGYSHSDLVKFIWLAKTLKDSPNEPPLRTYQRWKNAIYEVALKKNDLMHQTCDKSSLAITHKLDDMIKLPKSQPKKIYKEDFEYEMVMVKIPRFREVPCFDEPEPQPNPLPNCPPLDVSLRDERGPKPPIKPHSPDSFRMKEIDNLTIHTPPSPQVASFYPKDVYCYSHQGLGDPKKHYGFKPCLLAQNRSLGVDFLNLEVTFDEEKPGSS